MNRVLALCGACVLLATEVAARQAPGAPGTPAGPGGNDAKRGQQVWMSYSCYACHGYSGNGGNGPKLSQGGRFNNATALTAYVRNPTRPNIMPSYSSKVLSDAEIADIFTFLKSVPPSPSAREIPLLAELPQP